MFSEVRIATCRRPCVVLIADQDATIDSKNQVFKTRIQGVERLFRLAQQLHDKVEWYNNETLAHLATTGGIGYFLIFGHLRGLLLQVHTVDPTVFPP